MYTYKLNIGFYSPKMYWKQLQIEENNSHAVGWGSDLKI